MPSTTSPTGFDPLHYIDLVDGQFYPGGTTSADLDGAFDNINNIQKSNHLCVFFHGGLVSRSEGLDTASYLIGDYTDEGRAYPFFFIWNSGVLNALNFGLLDAVKKKMQRYENPLFAIIAIYTFGIVARKIKAALDNKRLRLPARGKQLATLARAYDQAWSKRAGAQLGCSQRELDQFVSFIVNREKNLPVGRRMFKRKNLLGLKNPLARICYRLNTKHPAHHHGLYTTIIEELLIAAELAAIVRNEIWLKLVGSIDRSFESGNTAGGTAFVNHLIRSWTKNPTLRVTLIGHSMGSIYIQRMIKALDARLPVGSTAQVEVIFLAAAISFAQMNETLSEFGKRVSRLRVFALDDRTESSYFEVPPIYDKSLLYIVSSLCEDDQNADKPLVGMQRYWTDYYDNDIDEIKKFIGKREVWAPTKPNAPPGWRSQPFPDFWKSKHGQFPKELCTRASEREILKNGFRPY